MVQINTNISCQIRIGVIELSFANNLNLTTRLLLMEQRLELFAYINFGFVYLYPCPPSLFCTRGIEALNMELHEVLTLLFVTKTRHVKMVIWKTRTRTTRTRTHKKYEKSNQSGK